jgi:CheY-like chemotaxis protein
MSDKSSILLVEDDPNDVFFLQRAFTAAAIDNPLSVAQDGQEAIDYLSGLGKYADRARHPLPCLIILDLKMPRRTGMDVLQWLREQPVFRCIPVIVFSSSAQRYDVERAYGLGATAFVVKPANNERRSELAALVKGFWLEFNERPLVCTESYEAAHEFHTRLFHSDPVSLKGE